MSRCTRIVIGLCLAGGTAFLAAVLWTDPAPELSGEKGKKRGPKIFAKSPPLVSAASQPRRAEQPKPALLPEPALLPPAVIPAAAPVPVQLYPERPAEETMLSSWAARDPEGAGRWLNQNRQHPKFADMVRGYAIQIATIDPAAARRWAAELKGVGNRFTNGGTLEQHIDAIESMLHSKGQPAQGAQTGQPRTESPQIPVLSDYFPALVRQHPDEPPVLEMEPGSPFV